MKIGELKKLIKEIVFEELSESHICFGTYELESFNSHSIISNLKNLSKEIYAYTIQKPDSESKSWNIKYIQFDSKDMQKILSLVKSGLREGWYCLLWDDKKIYIIFSNGTATLKNNGNALNPSISSIEKYSNLFKENELSNDYMNFWLNKALKKFKQIKTSK